MKETGIADLKNNLSRYLALVRGGEAVRILDRDRPIAQIVPIGEQVSGRPVGAEALAEMERKGLVRRGSGKIDAEILRRNPAGPQGGVVDALLDERNSR